MLRGMGCRRMRGFVMSVALMAASAVCAPTQVPVQLSTPASAAVHPRAKKAAPAMIQVINGTSVHTQTFAEGSRDGKVVGDSTSIRVLNGTTWSTASFAPQTTRKSVQKRGVTQVNILNGTQTSTKVFKGGVPTASKTAAQTGKHPVVVGIESGEGKSASAGKVVVGIESSDSAALHQHAAVKAAHPRRTPYHPAETKTH